MPAISLSTVNGSGNHLPAEILRLANLIRRNELAWRTSDIPAVIEAARRANLVNLGGDLQVRTPSGKWAEPTGVSVSVDTGPNDLPWHERVEETARAALASFQALQKQCDFEAIAREAFPALVPEIDDLKDVILFSWLVLNEEQAANMERDWKAD